MPSNKRKLQILAGLATLALLAVAVGCKGFFQNPQLQTITVGPQAANIQQGSTLQMTATGTYDDGSTQTLTKNVFWSTNMDTVAMIDTNSGVVTATGPGTATITGSQGAVSGSTSITVSLPNVVSIMLSPQTTSGAPGNQIPYTVTANLTGGGTADVTASATFTSTDTTNITFITGQSPVTCMIGNNTPVGEKVTITVTYTGSTVLTAQGTLNIN